MYWKYAAQTVPKTYAAGAEKCPFPGGDMCVGVPMRIISIDGTDAVAEIDGVKRDASLMLMADELRVGDYVIVHAGFAISKLDEDEARETLEMMREVFKPEDMR